MVYVSVFLEINCAGMGFVNRHVEEGNQSSLGRNESLLNMSKLSNTSPDPSV